MWAAAALSIKGHLPFPLCKIWGTEISMFPQYQEPHGRMLLFSISVHAHSKHTLRVVTITLPLLRLVGWLTLAKVCFLVEWALLLPITLGWLLIIRTSVLTVARLLVVGGLLLFLLAVPWLLVIRSLCLLTVARLLVKALLWSKTGGLLVCTLLLPIAKLLVIGRPSTETRKKNHSSVVHRSRA